MSGSRSRPQKVGHGHADKKVGHSHADEKVGHGHADEKVGHDHADENFLLIKKRLHKMCKCPNS